VDTPRQVDISYPGTPVSLIVIHGTGRQFAVAPSPQSNPETRDTSIDHYN